MLNDRLQPVVSTVGSRPPDPKLPKRELHFIDYDQDILRQDLEERHDGANGATTIVHISSRLHQDDVMILDHDSIRDRFPLRELRFPSSRQFIDDVEAHVMPRPGVFRPRVPQSDNCLHRVSCKS
jgi:hypothetical protein